MLEMHARNHRTRNIQLTEKTLSYEKYSGDIINTVYPNLLQTLLRNEKVLNINIWNILGDPGAASRDDEIFMGESLQQERESPWALTLTERVPEAFEIPPSDWPEKYFSGQSEGGISNASGTRSVRISGRKKTNAHRDFSRRTYRRYRKFLELATSPFSSVTNYFSFFVDLRLKLSISDARATQLC